MSEQPTKLPYRYPLIKVVPSCGDCGCTLQSHRYKNYDPKLSGANIVVCENRGCSCEITQDRLHAMDDAFNPAQRTEQSKVEPKLDELQAVEIGPDGRAYLIGIPGDDHNCDAMGCPSAAAHTIETLPLDADHRVKQALGRTAAFCACGDSCNVEGSKCANCAAEKPREYVDIETLTTGLVKAYYGEHTPPNGAYEDMRKAIQKVLFDA